MFTGLITHIGTIERIHPRGSGVELVVEQPELSPLLTRGESIAVDGVCLTVEHIDRTAFILFASPETIAKTNIGDRRIGDAVNLERALALGDRLGGHLVSGHVDATGHFESAREMNNAWEIRITAPEMILRQSIPKGSITIDGISLTIVELTAEGFSLWIIPETWNRTTMSRRQPGDRVNLESDLIGKYIFRYLETTGGAIAEERETALQELWQQFRSRE